jgi:hypothetical protein
MILLGTLQGLIYTLFPIIVLLTTLWWLLSSAVFFVLSKIKDDSFHRCHWASALLSSTASVLTGSLFLRMAEPVHFPDGLVIPTMLAIGLISGVIFHSLIRHAEFFARS